MSKQYLHLTISNFWRDQILAGVKKIEYRNLASNRNRSLLKYKGNTMVFHNYCSEERLLCDVESIKKIKTPVSVLKSGLAFESECIAIKLKNPKMTNKKNIHKLIGAK